MIIQSTSVSALPSLSQASSRQRLSFPVAEAAASREKVSISQAARALATESAKDSKTYDFSNMSPQQLLQTMNKLIKAGKMPVDESSSLVGLIPIAISKAQYDSQVSAAYYAPTNIFEKLQQAMAYDEYSHNEQALIYDRKALAALGRFQGTKT